MKPPLTIRKSKIEPRLRQLMADGRMRTTHEISERLNCAKTSTWRRLERMRLAGEVLLIQRGRGCAKSIWMVAK